MFEARMDGSTQVLTCPKKVPAILEARSQATQRTPVYALESMSDLTSESFKTGSQSSAFGKDGTTLSDQFILCTNVVSNLFKSMKQAQNGNKRYTAKLTYDGKKFLQFENVGMSSQNVDERTILYDQVLQAGTILMNQYVKSWYANKNQWLLSPLAARNVRGQKGIQALSESMGGLDPANIVEMINLASMPKAHQVIALFDVNKGKYAYLPEMIYSVVARTCIDSRSSPTTVQIGKQTLNKLVKSTQREIDIQVVNDLTEMLASNAAGGSVDDALNMLMRGQRGFTKFQMEKPRKRAQFISPIVASESDEEDLKYITGQQV